MRNLKTFVKNGKRYRVVFTTATKSKADKARGMYDNKITAVHHDKRLSRWLVGVR